MKKSVILTILIIYILAIVVVGFIGIALRIYDEKKYVESIECLSEKYVNEPVYDQDTNELIADGYIPVKKKDNPDLTVVIKCRALPADATNTKLKISVSGGYDIDNPPEDTTGYKSWYRDNGDGTWTIKLLEEKDQTITIYPTDRTGIKLKIRIMVKKSGADVF